jgi:pSer/pThr/pTyr-binding forkhead associated (FHA) protein
VTSTSTDRDQGSDDIASEMTSVFRADFLPKPDTPIRASGQDPSPGSALLVVKRGPNAGSRLVLDKPITSAGRHPYSDIFLDDVTVSRRHAEFRVTEDNDVQVVDVGSLNGTSVNRVPIASARLAHGDEVQLGKFRLVFLTGGPQAAPHDNRTVAPARNSTASTAH